MVLRFKSSCKSNITIIFYTHLFKENNLFFSLDSNEQKFNPVMSDQEEQMGEVIVTANNKSWCKESTTIEPSDSENSRTNAGIENILKPYRALMN
jgi:hypothetical protein